jgi:hypothetical protein
MFMKLSSLHRLIVLFGIASIFFAQFWYQFAPFIKNLSLFIFMVFSYMLVLFNKKTEGIIYIFGCIFLFSSLIIIGGLFGVYSFSSNMALMFFYFSIILGSLFSLYFDSYLKMIKVFILINLLVMIYEFVTVSYLLEPTSDSLTFKGRAKGFISYSKEAGGFILVFTLLFIRTLNVKWFVVLLFFSILSGSRLAMLIVFLAIIVELLYRIKIKHFLSPVRFFFSLLFMAIVMGGIYFYSTFDQSEIIINRLSGALDTGHSSNAQRIDFWLSHLAVYGQYSYYEYFIGSPGMSTSIVGNGAESAWINLITDGGIVALLIYLVAIVIMFLLSHPKLNSFFHFALLILAMQLSRVNIGFLDGTLFWAYLFYLIQKYSLNLQRNFNSTNIKYP